MSTPDTEYQRKYQEKLRRKRGILSKEEIKTKNRNLFITKSQHLHDNKYSYEKMDYKTSHQKVEILCNKHGSFFQTPTAHLRGQGCPECAKLVRSKFSKQLTKNTEDFINESSLKHQNVYSYEKVEYKNTKTPVIITCKVHGSFTQTPKAHLRGQGCPECAKQVRYQYQQSKKRTTSQFITESQEKYKAQYSYDLTTYRGTHEKTQFVCNKHQQSFFQTPYHHLKGIISCPKCKDEIKKSRGEEMISFELQKRNIIFRTQEMFKDCKRLQLLKFDFYLPEYNTLIEFDGEQHNKRNKRFHPTEEDFLIAQKRDLIKNEFAKQRGIRLIRIPHTKIISIPSIIAELV